MGILYYGTSPEERIEAFEVFTHTWDARKRDLFRRIVERTVYINGAECWQWTGSHSGRERGGGYGRMTYENHQLTVHRAMATLCYGYIHKKQHVDHKCGNRLCCNPAHLEVVSQKVNQQRRVARRELENLIEETGNHEPR